MNEYRQGSAPVGRAVSKARAGRCWASCIDEPALAMEQNIMERFFETLVATVFMLPLVYAIAMLIWNGGVIWP